MVYLLNAFPKQTIFDLKIQYLPRFFLEFLAKMGSSQLFPQKASLAARRFRCGALAEERRNRHLGWLPEDGESQCNLGDRWVVLKVFGGFL